MILATCANGHEVVLFPSKCIEHSCNCGDDINVEWECPRCPKDAYKYSVKVF